jgi:hypothetical protein
MKGANMIKKYLRLFLIIILAVGSLISISFGSIFAEGPLVTGVEDGRYYNEPVTITFEEAGGTVTATLNGDVFTSGQTVIDEGIYLLIVTDGVESTNINFTIDTTAPVVTGVSDGVYYNSERLITFNEGSATLNGSAFVSGTTVSAEGVYVLVVTDLANNVTTVNFTIDTTAPVVTGVSDGTYYNSERLITFNEGSATLNGSVFVSGTTVSAEGVYVLVVTDLANNVTTVNFTIDTTAPVVTGVSDGTYYNSERLITFNEGSATLNGSVFVSGTTVSAEGVYVLVVTDLANNVTTVNFTIDTTAPVVTGVSDGTYYNSERLITFNEGSATLNGSVFVSGTTVSAEGVYVLVVTDLANNVTTVNFTIDTTAPVVTGVSDGTYYNSERLITFNEGSATLNGSVFVSGTTVSAEGVYVLVVTDLANNITTVNFTIDTTAPVVTGVSDGSYYNSERLITFNEGSATLNGSEFVSGTTVSDEGVYVLVVTDLANNITTVNFTIDTTAPVVTGVSDGSYYNSERLITFNEGSATLNGSVFVSGTTVSDEGVYVLVVTDLANNITTVNFTIDTTAPVVTGVSDGTYYNSERLITFNEGSATLNGSVFVSGTTVSDEGVYVLVVTDLANNVTTVNFTIDTTAPVVTGVSDGTYYNSERLITFNEGSATLNGSVFVSGTTVSDEGVYVLVVTDLANNVTTVNFTIDTTAPVVTGVSDGTYYNSERLITFNEGSATLNGSVFVSGTTVSDEGMYVLVVTDLANNVTTVNFTIDTTAPVVTGVSDGTYYNSERLITFNEGSATLNGSVFVSGTTVSDEGVYVLVVTDLANNVTTVNFTIDTTAPVVTGVSDGVYYNSERLITFNEGSATLNGSAFVSGTTVSDEGVYVLVVTDLANNVTTVNFTIDTTAPVVTGVSDGTYYNSERLITFNEGSATLNGSVFVSGTTVSDEGVYVLVVTDLANNVTTVNFTIDMSIPVVTGVSNNAYYNVDRTITFDKGTATLNGAPFVSGSTVSAEGVYVLVVTDDASNSITINFVIDKTPPIVSGVVNNLHYNTNLTITFNEGSATLNGVAFVSGTSVSAEGVYVLVVTDLANNVTTVNFTIDTTAPVVTGVSNNAYYNVDRTISFNEGSATLNGSAFVSGTTVSAEGVYVLVVTDDASNSITINFVIDKTPPIVSGVVNNLHYNTNRTITFNEGSATLNGVAFVSGTSVSAEGVYVLVVTDLANNVTTVNFTIDTTAPVVTGVSNNAYYNGDRTITFNEGSATLNGSAFVSGTTVSAEAVYELIVTDLAGNQTTIDFVIDKTPPVITIAPYESVLAVSSVSVSASVNEGSLNTTLRLFTSNGSFKFVATDLAGNISERTVTITNIGYTLTYSLVGSGGDLIAMVNSIVVNSGNLVIEGRSIMFTATPANRYRVYAWRLDGSIVVDRSNTYLLNMLNRGMNVTVEFVLEGDLNSSGSVTITDLVKLSRYLAGLETVDNKGKVAADVNNSGTVTVTDLVQLSRRLAGLE